MTLRDSFIKRASTRELIKFECDMDEPLFIRPMRKGTKSKIEAMMDKKKTPADCSEVRWIVLRDCMCDSDGSDVLSVSDRSLFDEWDESFVEPVFNKALEVSGITDKEREALDEKN